MISKTPPPAFQEIVKAFSALQIESEPFDPVWKFWNFYIRWNGWSFVPTTEPARMISQNTSYNPDFRTTIEGVISLMAHQTVIVPNWQIGVTATSHKGRMTTAAVWFKPRLFQSEWFSIRRNTEPEAWPHAVLALYTGDPHPLIDYMFEQDRYAPIHNRLTEALEWTRRPAPAT
jgi:hypothetical protein